MLGCYGAGKVQQVRRDRRRDRAVRRALARLGDRRRGVGRGPRPVRAQPALSRPHRARDQHIDEGKDGSLLVDAVRPGPQRPSRDLHAGARDHHVALTHDRRSWSHGDERTRQRAMADGSTDCDCDARRAPANEARHGAGRGRVARRRTRARASRRQLTARSTRCAIAGTIADLLSAAEQSRPKQSALTALAPAPAWQRDPRLAAELRALADALEGPHPLSPQAAALAAWLVWDSASPMYAVGLHSSIADVADAILAGSEDLMAAGEAAGVEDAPRLAA